jgi:hypothetical protein
MAESRYRLGHRLGPVQLVQCVVRVFARETSGKCHRLQFYRTDILSPVESIDPDKLLRCRDRKFLARRDVCFYIPD